MALSSYSSKEAIALFRMADVPADLLALPEDLLHDFAASAQLTEIVVNEQMVTMPALPLRINGEYPPITFPS
jgi:crotonobetainyl-CoA:carnitine CoA-transferase CaiB-like acyl-CoA transferase